MFTVNLKGGLCNQLFQIAFLEYIKKNTGIDYFIQSNDVSRNVSVHSNISYFDTILKHWKQYSNTTTPTLLISEHENMYPENWIGIANTYKDKTILFDGYFQNYAYITDDFINKLTFSEDIIKRVPFISDKVFIHIRGGDYVNHHVHDVRLKDYYARAIRSFPKETEFVISTNDISYTKSILDLNSIRHSIIEENEIDSLYLMSQCKGGICANSTFSWWGGFLNKDRHIILPSKWFNNSNTYSKGYYYPSSIVLDV